MSSIALALTVIKVLEALRQMSLGFHNIQGVIDSENIMGLPAYGFRLWLKIYYIEVVI